MGELVAERLDGDRRLEIAALGEEGYSADEIAVLHDWFSRSTNLALAYIEELRAKDADGK
jgi:hypothetical protein